MRVWYPEKEIKLAVKSIIFQSRYVDSVRLMSVAKELSHLPGVKDAVVVMGTQANKGILKQSGLLTHEAELAGANDLVISLNGTEEAFDKALAEVEELLSGRSSPQREAAGSNYLPRTISAAQRSNPLANMVVVSVSGRYAAAEAWKALHSGLNVLLFSDNVSLDDEIALKTFATQEGLLLMGPGAGTALINGIGLGFSNQVPRGPVGIVSAAGTGLQETSTLLARLGCGVSQGLGTGGRDLSEPVGGLMMLSGIKALQQDPDTKVILLVSKPPADVIAKKMIMAVGESAKPVVICFLGSEKQVEAAHSHLHWAATLQEAAYFAAREAGIGLAEWRKILADEEQQQVQQAAELVSKFNPGQRYLRGLYSGGTLCYEAQVIWRNQFHSEIYSNAPLDPLHRLADVSTSRENTVLDLGEEEFTLGRLHPMIDNELRIRRMQQEAADPQTAVIILDVVLGFGAHPNPAAELGAAIRQVKDNAKKEGRELAVIASVTGTPGDPQGYSAQTARLKAAGAIICDCNASAARLVGRILERL
jgi:FdrA protein